MNKHKLDVLTAKGKAATADEKSVYAALAVVYPNMEIFLTPKNKPARADAIAIYGVHVYAVIEVKSRNMTVEQANQFKTWIVTADKLDACIDTARNLNAKLITICYCQPSRAFYMWNIIDENGDIVVDVERRRTKTQKTVNGGEAERLNAFIPFLQAKLYYMDDLQR